jgi:phosphomannomutase
MPTQIKFGTSGWRAVMAEECFTASHSAPEYNGIKFSTPDGCPALLGE